MLVIKSVFQTCAFAGFPYGSFGVRRRSDGRLARLNADALVPRPPDGSSGTTVSGRLAPELIQATIRRSYDGFRKCYQSALARDPDIEGRVVARFVIARDGTVSNATNDGSTFPDPDTITCMLDGFRKLRFPAPEGGIVTVVYPIVFTP
jgi:hypothetical protein